jgi:hypothetical protein
VTTEPWWARLPGWAAADDDPPRPAPGATWPGVGLRLLADALGPPLPGDGLVTVDASVPPAERRYRATGTVSSPRAVESVQPGPPLLELVLHCGDVAVQVHAAGRVPDLGGLPRLTAVGTLEVVAGYEWDDFALVDTRSSWLVGAVVASGDRGDVLVALSAAGAQPGGPTT